MQGERLLKEDKHTKFKGNPAMVLNILLIS